jgi:large subunit ribosomal protein L13
MKTYMAKTGEVSRKWWIIDAKGQTLGRMCNQIAQLLRGKHKPQFTPQTDTGDFVVVINAEQVEMSGQKWQDKKYYRHSRFFGSLKEKSAELMREQNPAFVIEDAVYGMLPKNKLSRKLLAKLKTYKGTDHPHAAQKPEPWAVKN